MVIPYRTTEREAARNRKGDGSGSAVYAEPPLIGRADEYKAVCVAVDSISKGRGQIVTISGDQGVGKSRLIDEARRYAASRYPRILWLSGVAEERVPSSYDPFRGVLRSFVAGAARVASSAATLEGAVRSFFGADRIAVDAAESVEWLERFVTFPSEFGDHQAMTAAEREYEIQRSFERLFTSLATRCPVALALDDLQWADRPTFDVIRLLMDRTSDRPLLLILAHRPESESDAPRLTKMAIRHNDRLFPLNLHDLNADEADELIASILGVKSVPDRFLHAVLGRCGGNPLYVRAALEALRDTNGLLSADDLKSATLPGDVREAVVRRVEALNEDARETIRAAAVIGPRFDVDLLEPVLENVRDMEAALSILQDRRLLLEFEAWPNPCFFFAHVFVQQAIYQSIPAEARRRLHTRIPLVIERQSANRRDDLLGELAEHYAAAGDIERAITLFVECGERERRVHANEIAAGYYEHAYALASDDAPKDSDRSLRLRETLGDLRLSLGKHTEAEADYVHCLRATTLALNAPRLIAKRAEAAFWLGEYDRAIRLAVSGLDTLSDAAAQEAVLLWEIVCRSQWAKNEWTAAHDAADQLMDAVRQAEPFPLLYKALYRIAYTKIQSNDAGEALAWLLKMEEHANASEDQDALALCLHGLGDLYRDRFEDADKALDYFQRSLSRAQRTRNYHLLLEGYLESACLLIRAGGDAREIGRHLTKADEVAARMASAGQNIGFLPQLYEMVADAYDHRGAAAGCIDYLRRAIAFDPPDMILYRLLCKLEAVHRRQRTPNAFHAFCRERETLRTTAFRRWRFVAATPSSSFDKVAWDETDVSASADMSWTWVDPDGESSFVRVDSGFEIRSAGRRSTSSPRFDVPHATVQAPSTRFAVEAIVEPIDSSLPMAGGVAILNADSTELIAFGAPSGRGNDLRLDQCRGGSHGILGRGWLPRSGARLRLECDGRQVRALCKNDGDSEWRSCGRGEFTPSTPTHVGIYVCGDWNLRESGVRFSDFRILTGNDV